VVLLVTFRVSAVVLDPVPRADSCAIAVWSWPSLKRGASGLIWDIDHVPSMNFN
jgi:hypothetical protein